MRLSTSSVCVVAKVFFSYLKTFFLQHKVMTNVWQAPSVINYCSFEQIVSFSCQSYIHLYYKHNTSLKASCSIQSCLIGHALIVLKLCLGNSHDCTISRPNFSSCPLHVFPCCYIVQWMCSSVYTYIEDCCDPSRTKAPMKFCHEPNNRTIHIIIIMFQRPMKILK